MRKVWQRVAVAGALLVGLAATGIAGAAKPGITGGSIEVAASSNLVEGGSASFDTTVNGSPAPGQVVMERLLCSDQDTTLPRGSVFSLGSAGDCAADLQLKTTNKFGQVQTTVLDSTFFTIVPVVPPCNTAPAPTGGDDSAALQAWLDAAPDGSTLCFPEAAHYTAEGTFEISQRHDLVVEGQGATLEATSLVGDTDPVNPKCCVRTHVELDRSTGITISNLTVRSANSECRYNGLFEFEHAFNVRGSHGILLDGVKAYGVAGDFVNFTEFKDPTLRDPATDIEVRNFDFDCNGRQGFAFSGGTSRVWIHDGTVGNVARTLVDIEQIREDQTTEDVAFTDNAVGFVRNVICCGGLKGTVRNVTFSNNTLPKFWLKVGDIFNVIMEHNSAQPFAYGGGAPWGFSGTHGVTFVDNHAPLAAGSGAASALGLVGQATACDVFVADSSVAGAGAFWPPPGPPGPEGCLWTDGGGNSV